MKRMKIIIGSLCVLCVLAVAFDAASQKKISMKKPAAASPAATPRPAATARPAVSAAAPRQATTAPRTAAARPAPTAAPRAAQHHAPAVRQQPRQAPVRRTTQRKQYTQERDDDDIDDNYSRYNNRYNRNYDPRYDPRYHRGNDPRYDPRYNRGYDDPRYNRDYDPRYYPRYNRGNDPRNDPRYNRGYDPRNDPRYNRNYDRRTIATAPSRPEAVSNTERNEVITMKGVSFTMVAVQGGTFTMGATGELGGDVYDWERPAHSVTLSSFSIGQTEVTQELWEAVMGNNPSNSKGKKRPVEQVSWDDCQKFVKKLNKLTGKNFRLPTEAEWEYAARGGSKSRGHKYSGSNDIGSAAWHDDNSGGGTHDVGTKSPNELGLYDMSGNVWEWCADWYGSYSSGSQSNPSGPSSGSFRVSRGGSWDDYARYCRVSYRSRNAPVYGSRNLGFRLAL